MRIAYVCADPGIPVFGGKGASVHVQEVLRVLVRRGATIDLYCARTGGAAPRDLAAVRVTCVPPAAAASAAAREHAAMVCAEEIGRRLRRAGPVDLVYERYALWGGAGAHAARLRGVPCVLEVNAPLIDEHARYRTLVHRERARQRLAAALRAATTVACVSGTVARWVLEHGADPAATVVAPNGVDTHRIRPRPAPAADGPFTVGFVGTLKPWHGVGTLVEAMARLGGTDRSRLWLVGDGPERSALAGAARRLGIADRVHVTGAIPPSAVPAELHRLDAAVAPYPPERGARNYFSPLKLYEYLAAGLPVVASDVGQAAEVLTPGVDGLLVPAGDAEALAAALRTLRDSPALRGRLGAQARETAVLRHTWERTVGATLAAAGLGSGRDRRGAA